MRIAFFTDSYRPIRDGVASVVGDLATELARQGHQVSVFAPAGAGARAGVRSERGVEVIRVRGIPVPHYPEYRWAAFPFPALRGHGLGQVDIVHIHTPGVLGSLGFLVGRRYRRPVVATFHTNFAAMRPSFPDSPSVRLFFRAAWYWAMGTYYHADLTTAPTREAAGVISAATRKPFRTPVRVIPNGVDTERFHPDGEGTAWSRRLGADGRPVILYLGRLTRDKGVHRFLDAIAALPTEPGVLAVVGGTGPEAGRVAERIGSDPRLAGRALFLGEVAEEDKPALFASGALFVLPSTSDTSSVALLEAMACGVPPVVSDRGGARELIDDGRTGFATAVEPPAALAGGIAAALADSSRRAAVARAAREYVVARGSVRAAAGQFISLYGLLMAGRDGGATHEP